MPDTRTFLFEGGEGKLVYDGFIADHKAFGAKTRHRILSSDERVETLRAKLYEEQAELAAAQTYKERQKEQRDVNDVLFALGELMLAGYVPARRFDIGIFATAVTLPVDPGNKEAAYWIEYYSSQPERFPEETEND